MTPCKKRMIRLAAFGLGLGMGLGLLTGCVGSPSQPTRFYLLSASQPEDAAPASLPAGKAVLLGPVTLPGYLDRPQIVTHQSDNKLALSELDQWGEPLHDNLKRVLIENLSTLLQSNEIYGYPASLRPGPDTPQLAVDIPEIRFNPDGSVLLRARWSLYTALQGKPAKRQSKSYRSDEGGGIEENSRALSRLLGELAADLAKAIAEDQLASS